MRREREGAETGYIAKIKDLLAECQHMAAYGEEIWARDAEALEWAIKQLGGEEAGEG